MPEDTPAHLETIRQLEARGDYLGADQYLENHLLQRQRPFPYQYVGWLKIDYLDAAEILSTYRK